ncbi:hypothetical protein FACS1894109_17540 [Spirochaetia bacterium]|nr:hypothetical protein FACS1894109_17540 [Spirochaetia bacterium]
MTDTVTVSRLTAYFNRLPVERQSEILGIAEAFAFTQRGADSDSWDAMRGILREPLIGELPGKDTGGKSDGGAAVGLGVNARKKIYLH